jgi:ABC-2 type transport system permease protein
MFNLLRNENMKIYRRARTWIMLAILIGITILSSGLMAHYSPNLSNNDWRVEEQQSLQMNQQMMNDKDLPAQVRENLQRAVQTSEYRLANNIPPESTSMWGAANQLIVNLMQLVTIFVVIIAGDIVANEFSTGTIKLLAIRPISRTKLLLSKYVATMAFGLTTLALLFIVTCLSVGIFYGFEGSAIPHLYLVDHAVKEMNMVFYIWNTIGYHSISIIMVATLAFMISTIFRSSSMAIGISIFTFLISQILVPLLARFEWMKYYLFTNVDLTQHLEGLPIIEGMTLGFSISIILIYFIIMNAVSWLVFNKRDIAV